MSRHRDWDLSCKVYVGNLGNSASKNELESSFGKYGPLKNVWVARNPPGFAFIEFEDPRDAEDAVRHLDGTRLCGVRIRAEMSTGRNPSGRGRGSAPPRRGGDRGYGGGRSRSRSPAARRRFSRSRSRSHSRSRSRGRRSRSDSRERR
ncbi:serine/arginine-rich splicing factor 3 isoform X2 [Folsomia candida]|uniref:serine/arginine-rich splicing factor 3 isoform X2 n=1 Tax=Folsomia candida TaxID=158441 RepID=UPI000B8F8E69|nr:serine/arginine-rich splicing factor 3 isoform X2 [Folsomia candida]XP_021954723.1 serine/arginine-rich splicing factor 3 isoform X2 [Folsomia candida]